MNYVSEWQQATNNIGQLIHGFVGTGESEALFDYFVGSRPGFAKLRLKLEPSSFPEIFNGCESDIEIPVEIIRGVMLGVMDILFVAKGHPMFGVKVTILDIEVREVESWGWTFRMAARMVTLKIIATLQFPVIPNTGKKGTINFKGDFSDIKTETPEEAPDTQIARAPEA